MPFDSICVNMHDKRPLMNKITHKRNVIKYVKDVKGSHGIFAKSKRI